LAEVLGNLGSKHILVVHGEDGLDEVTITGKTFVTEARSGELRDYLISPEDFGIRRADPRELEGGDARKNAEIAMEILHAGKGSRRDAVLLNSACAIYAADKAATIAEGLEAARESIDSGAALKKLQLLKEYSQ
ncbi:MAG: anthranilate phosphoribosyltransferase, partial [Candidatus Omnitrophota bacterium]